MMPLGSNLCTYYVGFTYYQFNSLTLSTLVIGHQFWIDLDGIVFVLDWSKIKMHKNNRWRATHSCLNSFGTFSTHTCLTINPLVLKFRNIIPNQLSNFWGKKAVKHLGASPHKWEEKPTKCEEHLTYLKFDSCARWLHVGYQPNDQPLVVI